MNPFDYIIVGAGAAGCVLAARLSEDPGVRVLLLEAGGPDTDRRIRVPVAFSTLFRTAYDWAFTTAPETALGGRQLYWPRGKGLGGSTSINAMIYIRGHRADYDGWAAAGNAGWSYDDVLPHFVKAEDQARGASAFHGTGGPVRVEDARELHPLSHLFIRAGCETGVVLNDDFNGAEQDGVGAYQLTQRRGRRWSAADAYLQPTLGRPNLTVRTGAQATRLMTSERRVIGVEYRHGGERKTVRARREVVLAAGAVGSAQLLLVSGIGPGAHLQAAGVPVVRDLPGVGANLQDHVVVGIKHAITQPVSLRNADSLAARLRYLLFRRGGLTSNVAEAGGFMRTRLNGDAPDLQLLFAPVLFSPEGIDDQVPHGMSLGATLLKPASVGRLRVVSPDALEAPIIEPCYLSDPDGEDLRVLREGIHLSRRIFAASSFDSVRGDELAPGPDVRDDATLDAYIRAACETMYHPVGTCKMGLDADAVVAPDLRVHGIDGLRVADASIMPSVVRGNTMAPTMMIAEKAVDLIRAAACRPAAALV